MTVADAMRGNARMDEGDGFAVLESSASMDRDLS